MNNKTLVSTIIASAMILSTQVSATSLDTSAALELITPIVIAEDAVMNFGLISIANGECILDEADVATGGLCIGGATLSGGFSLTGDANDATVTITASGTQLAGILFEPTTTTATVTADGGSFKVGGKLTIADASLVTDRGVQSIGYTVDVVY